MTGQGTPRSRPQVLEFAGTVRAMSSLTNPFKVGDRVVAIVPSTLSTHIRVPYWCCVKLKDDESFEEMATVPNAYAAALYTLIHQLTVQPKESVLIHGAIGEVGLAAIRVSQSLGAEVFATVETLEQKQNLASWFGLDPNHVLNLRDCSFQRRSCYSPMKKELKWCSTRRWGSLWKKA